MNILSLLKRFSPLFFLVALLGSVLVFMGGIPSLGEALWKVYLFKQTTYDHFVWSISLYMLSYIAVVALSLPLSAITTIVGASLFGVIIVPFVVISVVLGCLFPYMASYCAFGDWCLKRLDAYPNVRNKMKEQSFFYLIGLRLIVIVPLWILNLAAGALRIPILTYIISTAIGILPGTLAFVLIGSSVGEALNSSVCKAGNCSITLEDFGSTSAILGLLLLGLLFFVGYLFRGKILGTPSQPSTSSSSSSHSH